MALEVQPYLPEGRGSRRKQEKNNSNLIVINEECPLCQSTAKPVGCSKCYTLLCEDCIDYFNGKPVCSFCCDELENPKRLAKVLMFCAEQHPAARRVPIKQRHRALR